MKLRQFSWSLLALMALSPISLSAQTLDYINPQPQKVLLQQGHIAVPKQWTTQSDKVRLSTALGQSTKEVLGTIATLDPSSGFKLTLGIRGDKAVKAVEKRIPTQAEGYYISVTPKGITLAAADERGLFYGAQTLKQLVRDGQWAVCEITDYPDVRYRGVVEGFYGTPWSHRDRLAQLEFYGRNKMNVYFYGPKDDPYHSVPNWRKDYPAKEAEQIKTLVETANKNGVIFYWAIHPGQDIKWTTEDRDNLLHKFESMYQLGVRAFAVFFDDITGEGTKADKQAELLNYIDDNFIAKKKDVAPLVMCPTEYNKGWSNIAGGYLPTLGDKLNKDIEIMWTGNTVVATIDKPDMAWINGHIKRNAYIWFNFPVSDFVRDHLLLGATYGNSKEIAPMLSGFLSNPMERAEASKISLYSVADYTWNMEDYDSEASWRKAIKDLLPAEASALQTVANHSSDLGPNGHRFRRDESVALQPIIKRIGESHGRDAEAVTLLRNEAIKLKQAADILLASKSNPYLIQEMAPWLRLARLVGEYGQQSIDLYAQQKAKDTEAFLSTYQHVRALQALMYEIDATENQNPYQPGVKLGTLHLLPAFHEFFTHATENYNKQTGMALSTKAVYLPFTMESDVPQLASLPLQTRGKNVNVSPSNEVIKWKRGQSITLRADGAITLRDIAYQPNKPEVAKHFKFEAEINGQWQSFDLVQDAKHYLSAPKANGATITALRLTQIGQDELEVYFREFRVGLTK